MTELWSSFLTHRGRQVHKWTHYFPAYEIHLARYRNRPCVLVEIGVAHGGSLQLWKQYLGPLARIVGIDVLDLRHFEDDQVAIRVGSQSDAAFLDDVVAEFGPPDVVIDDGSHVMDDVTATFRHLYPLTSPTGVYMVEDLHTAYWPEYGGGLGTPGSFIELAKSLVDELNADHARGAPAPTEFTASTLSMHFYDSMVIFERGRHLHKHALRIGEELPVGPPAGGEAG